MDVNDYSTIYLGKDKNTDKLKSYGNQSINFQEILLDDIECSYR